MNVATVNECACICALCSRVQVSCLLHGFLWDLAVRTMNVDFNTKLLFCANLVCSIKSAPHHQTHSTVENDGTRTASTYGSNGFLTAIIQTYNHSDETQTHWRSINQLNKIYLSVCLSVCRFAPFFFFLCVENLKIGSSFTVGFFSSFLFFLLLLLFLSSLFLLFHFRGNTFDATPFVAGGSAQAGNKLQNYLFNTHTEQCKQLFY